VAARAASTVLALAGAILMPLSLSLDWYHVDTGDSNFDLTGWNAFEFADFVLVAAGAVTLVSVLGMQRTAHPAERSLVTVGAATVGVVLIEMIDKPPLLGFGLHSSLRAGAFLGLSGAILVLLAGALQLLVRSGARQPSSP
jgi:hypothetical protein